jgi:hypothetical protein
MERSLLCTNCSNSVYHVYVDEMEERSYYSYVYKRGGCDNYYYWLWVYGLYASKSICPRTYLHEMLSIMVDDRNGYTDAQIDAIYKLLAAY